MRCRALILFAAIAGLCGPSCHSPDGFNRVRLSLIDARTKEPMAGVIRVIPQGAQRGIAIKNLLCRGEGASLSKRTKLDQWYVLPGPSEVELPREKLTIEAFSGIETKLASVQVDLREKSSQSVTIPLEFFSRTSRKGWYSGNTHCHLRNLSKQEAERYLKEVPKADDLDVLFISYCRRPGADPTSADPIVLYSR